MKAKTLADALGSVFDLSPRRRHGKVLQADYVRPSTGSDKDAMAKDFKAVGADIRWGMEQHGQR